MAGNIQMVMHTITVIGIGTLGSNQPSAIFLTSYVCGTEYNTVKHVLGMINFNNYNYCFYNYFLFFIRFFM